MFVKLTKLDNSPIWLNASFVVTVEPRRGGGAIVVPIGDGLDYDVRESPEEVLKALEGAPSPSVVPVPTKDALSVKRDEAAEDALAPETASKAEGSAEEPPPVKKARKTTRKASVATKAAAKTATKTRKRTAKKASEESVAEAPLAEAPLAEEPVAEAPLAEAPVAEAPAKDEAATGQESNATESVATESMEEAPAAEMPDEQVERLKKMRPRTVRKLVNTLMSSQFHIADAMPIVKQLAIRGVYRLDGTRIIWN